MMVMNDYLERISQFKGDPYEVGVHAGRRLRPRLERIINSYIVK